VCSSAYTVADAPALRSGCRKHKYFSFCFRSGGLRGTLTYIHHRSFKMDVNAVLQLFHPKVQPYIKEVLYSGKIGMY
jgi:hypothetical protein